MTIDKSNQEPDEVLPLAEQTEAKEAAEAAPTDDCVLRPPRPGVTDPVPAEASTETPTDDIVLRPPRPGVADPVPPGSVTETS